jgi:hypothetical protein
MVLNQSPTPMIGNAHCPDGSVKLGNGSCPHPDVIWHVENGAARAILTGIGRRSMIIPWPPSRSEAPA